METSTQEVLAHWHDTLQQPGGLTRASRYELERCAHLLWQEIMANQSVPDAAQAAYQAMVLELRLRHKLGQP